jgi:hypothetical protein
VFFIGRYSSRTASAPISNFFGSHPVIFQNLDYLISMNKAVSIYGRELRLKRPVTVGLFTKCIKDVGHWKR